MLICVVMVCEYPWGYKGQGDSWNHEADDFQKLQILHSSEALIKEVVMVIGLWKLKKWGRPGGG